MAFQTQTEFEGDCLVCCRKCKGLFPIEQDSMKHISTCDGSPFKSPCILFACERKIFLQLLRIEEFEGKGVSNGFRNLDEDMQLQTELETENQFIQRASDIGSQTQTTAQPLFLQGTTQIVVHATAENHSQYIQVNGSISSQCERTDHNQFLSAGSQCADHNTLVADKNEEMTVSEMADSGVIPSESFFPRKIDESVGNALTAESFFPSKMDEPAVTISQVINRPRLIQEPLVEEQVSALIKPDYLNDGNDDKVKSAIARNLKYLQDTSLTRIPSPIEKQLGLFCDSRLSFPRLHSPIEKQFQIRMQSPVDKAINFLGEPGMQGLQSSSQTYSSNPSIPYSCNLATDLLGSCSSQEDNPACLSSIEEFPTLQYLDLAKKDPFWGQNIGLSQINSKDPFLITAAEPSAKLSSQKMSSEDKSTEDINMQSSPTLPFQDENYFNFASTLDEPTQLDYLDLATLDFLTNPNLGTYGAGPLRSDRYPSDKEDINYPGDLMSSETNPFSSEAAAYPLSHSHSSEDLYTHSQHNRPGDIGINKSLFKPISNKPGNRNKQISKRSKTHSLRKKVSKGLEKTNLQQTEIDSSGEPSSKVQKVDDKDKPDRLSKNTQKSTKIQTELNVKEHLEGFTEEEKTTFKAVLGPNRSIVVKKIKLQHPAHSEPEVLGENPNFKTVNVADRKMFHCKRCNYTSSSKDNIEKHVEEHAVNMTLKCPECTYSCCHMKALKAHFATQHSKQKQVACELCGDIFKDRSKLQNHMTKHTGEHKFECNQCDYKTNLKISYTDHMKKHAGIYLYCDKEGCEFKTFYYRVLVQHKKKHDGLKQHVCEHCSYSTADVGSLKRHVQLQHLNERNFKCSKCNYYSVNKFDVVIHLRNKHFQLKTYHCNQCDFKTGYANGLKLHLMSHAGIRPYKCSACDFRTNKTDFVKRHIKNVHSDKTGVTVERVDLPFQIDSKKFKCEDADNDNSELEKYVVDLSLEERKQGKQTNKTKKTNGKKDNKESESKAKREEKTVLLKNIIDISGTSKVKGKTVSLIMPNVGSSVAKTSLTRKKSDNEIPSSVSRLIKTINIPATSDRSEDVLTTYQCSFCLTMYTSVSEVIEHVLNCKNNYGSEKQVTG